MRYYSYMQGVLYEICKKIKGTPLIRPCKHYSDVSGEREQKHSFYVNITKTAIKIGSNVPHGPYAVGIKNKNVAGGMKYYLPKNVPTRAAAVKTILEAIEKKIK